VIVCIATFGIFTLRFILSNLKGLKTFSGIIAGVCNSVIIIVLNKVYRKVAVWLTNWENHRTDAEYENSFIIKSFLFQFVNSYISLIYIAFMKGRFNLFGIANEQCIPDCISELTVQLGSIFMMNMFVGQFMEVGLPFVLNKLNEFRADRSLEKQHHGAHFTPAEKESKLGVYENAFDDYNEMILQFGYCTLFAAAFPAAPLAALINNVIEMRTDALKLLKENQRPHPRNAIDIGNWYLILHIMSYVAIVSNSALLIFTSHAIRDRFSGLDPSDLIWVAVGIEHAILITKYILSKAIPDSPQWVRLEIARRQYWKELAFEKEQKKKKILEMMISNEMQSE